MEAERAVLSDGIEKIKITTHIEIYIFGISFSECVFAVGLEQFLKVLISSLFSSARPIVVCLGGRLWQISHSEMLL